MAYRYVVISNVTPTTASCDAGAREVLNLVEKLVRHADTPYYSRSEVAVYDPIFEIQIHVSELHELSLCTRYWRCFFFSFLRNIFFSRLADRNNFILTFSLEAELSSK